MYNRILFKNDAAGQNLTLTRWLSKPGTAQHVHYS